MSVLAVVFIGILGKRIMICNAFDLINRDYIFRRNFFLSFSSRHCCYYLTNGNVTAVVLSSKLRQGNNNAANAVVSSSLVSAGQPV